MPILQLRPELRCGYPGQIRAILQGLCTDCWLKFLLQRRYWKMFRQDPIPPRVSVPGFFFNAVYAARTVEDEYSVILITFHRFLFDKSVNHPFVWHFRQRALTVPATASTPSKYKATDPSFPFPGFPPFIPILYHTHPENLGQFYHRLPYRLVFASFQLIPSFFLQFIEPTSYLS